MRARSKDLDDLNGKTSIIFREISVFPNLSGILPFIFQTQYQRLFLLQKFSQPPIGLLAGLLDKENKSDYYENI
ncbi:hypothetical protein D1B31_12230 [Neobacillus notoginsengisoli]|uniref:Uncharacterized protein n=1 Tax=Neobacillus notoginsengisoli TaxID=1578198 RepID=A0A417YTG9_9BACI|nr:hypothetical protein D1B31_12230 [Neobacillus notoginsengisoli]